MASSTPTFKFTYEDYRNAPEDKRYELLDGDLVVVPAPKEVHQRASRNLTIVLTKALEGTEAGEVYVAPFDVVLSETDVVQPDLLYISNERAHIITEDNVQGAPDLVIEILSPATAERDLTFKRSLYAKHGVKEYWLVDTDARTVTVLSLEEHRYRESGVYGEGHTLTSAALKGLAVDPVEIF